MKFKSLFLVALYSLFCQEILAQIDTIKVNKKRVLIVSSSLGAALEGLIGIYKILGGAINKHPFILTKGQT